MKLFFLTLLVIAAASPSVFAADKLVIISPHRKSLEQEFLPAFVENYKKTHGTEVKIEWIDQGGTSDDVRFVRAKFAKNPKTSDIDIFWGGGSATFMELDHSKLLERYELPKDLQAQVPADAAGTPLYDSSKTWYGQALSAYGIFFNKKILKLEGLPEPKVWQDLADPKFINSISVTDPRHSGTATAMNNVILQTFGWDKGWQVLSGIAGNTRMFTQSSSDPIKAVVSGDAVAAMAIDFYAYAKIQDLGKDNLGFILPAGQTVLDPDPVAILKGAPNRKVAERFIDFILAAEPQKLLVLAKGAPGGPKTSFLGRMAVNTKTYELTEGKRFDEMNPFKLKSLFKMDQTKAARTNRIFNDLIGSIFVDTHKDLKSAWTAIVKRGAKEADVAAFAKPPVTEKEFNDYAAKWDDNVFRNKTINAWVEASRRKYTTLANNSH